MPVRWQHLAITPVLLVVIIPVEPFKDRHLIPQMLVSVQPLTVADFHRTLKLVDHSIHSPSGPKA